MKQKFLKGFTLVELLIVIALIAILSVAVLSTINPIEQSNKARDAKFKNDAAEVMNATERYYASINKYQWTSVYPLADGNYVADNSEGIAFTSLDPRFGITGNAIVADEYETQGPLIKTSELKGVFKGKEEFAATAIANNVDAMYIFHSTDSNYVCFCPKAKANRTGPNAAFLKCLNNVTTVGNPLNASTATLVDIDAASCLAPTEAEASSTTFCNVDVAAPTFANLMCVPEGNIQN